MTWWFYCVKGILFMMWWFYCVEGNLFMTWWFYCVEGNLFMTWWFYCLEGNLFMTWWFYCFEGSLFLTAISLFRRCFVMTWLCYFLKASQSYGTVSLLWRQWCFRCLFNFYIKKMIDLSSWKLSVKKISLKFGLHSTILVEFHTCVRLFQIGITVLIYSLQ